MDRLWVDFESKSTVDLEVHGLDRYAKDPSTQVLLLGHALNDEPVQVWEPHLAPFPVELEEQLQDPFIVKSAFNVAFERNIFRYVLGRDIPVDEWSDIMIQARHLSITGGLDQVCEVLGLKENEAKIADGKRLIDMFCYPVCEAREETLFGAQSAIFRDWSTDPEDWRRFKEYCARDVEAERAAFKKMARFPLPDNEQRGWILDQIINERGVPVDLELVRNALHISDQAKYALDLRMKKITGLDNPQSPKQLMEWAKKQGYPFNSMGKIWIQRAIDSKEISEDCREVFKMRQQASKTSWAKLEAIQNIVSADGRVRHQFAFLGSTRAGRWSGRDIQMQNLPKPSPAIEKNLELAVELVRAGQYDQIKQKFPNEMDVVSGVIRAAFRAPSGQTFDIADLNAIENRVLGWITGCGAILDVFRKKLDPYKDFATRLYKIAYEAVTKDQRTISKPAVLGAGYRLSGGEEAIDKWGNPIKTGLWGYAWAMGIQITQEDAHYSVQVFREAYKEVVQGWYDLENTALRIIQGDGPREVCKCEFRMRGRVLEVELPSGRCLHYIDPKIESFEFFGKMKPMLTYSGQTIDTKQWNRIKTHGGKLTENLCQAIARDVLLHGLQLADRQGIQIVAHIHDEAVALSDTSRLTDLIACMSEVPKWANGLILGADGFSSTYYKKG
jgi:DNA polymerase